MVFVLVFARAVVEIRLQADPDPGPKHTPWAGGLHKQPRVAALRDATRGYESKKPLSLVAVIEKRQIP